MAHEIDTTKGFAAMAYVGEKPWHGLGQELQQGASIEEWRKAAGMDFDIQSTPAKFQYGPASYDLAEVADRKVLFRSDSKQSLAVVSNAYQIVQPGEVLEFYRDLTEKAGFNLETAGVLRGGKKYWALASMGQEAMILDDKIKGYLLLGTACDGSMSTVAMFTSIRVVCNNTLTFAVEEKDKQYQAIRINHRTTFDADKVKAQLGLAATSWNSFVKQVEVWANTPMSQEQALDYFSQVATYKSNDGEEVVSDRTVKLLQELFEGAGKGATLQSANGTVWGAVNAVTEFVDHHRGRSGDVRLDRAWFGDGQNTKGLATFLANELV